MNLQPSPGKHPDKKSVAGWLVLPTLRWFQQRSLYFHLCVFCSAQRCPLGLVASKDKVNYPNSASHYQDNGDGTGGFIDVKACVTQDGYGATGRGGQPCDAGKYNKKDEYE